jgi:hypothetical protein
MRGLTFGLLLLLLIGCTNKIKSQPLGVDMNSSREYSFGELWSKIASNPLDRLPQNSISLGSLSKYGESIILKDAKRTIDNRADILEPFDKLAHPNGICLKGIWEIDRDNIYSGYFQKGSRGLLIARASTAMSNTKQGATRAFGFAGKLYPTTNPNLTQKTKANFFLIDDLGGTDAKHYADVALINEPNISTTLEVAKNLFYALKVSKAFGDADKNPTIRQLYEISQLSESKDSKIITPKWMKIEVSGDKRYNEIDFRDELKVATKNSLIFNISVSSEKDRWQEIGTITIDNSVVSNPCDHQLHFPHPKWRDDLRYR